MLPVIATRPGVTTLFWEQTRALPQAVSTMPQPSAIAHRSHKATHSFWAASPALTAQPWIPRSASGRPRLPESCRLRASAVTGRGKLIYGLQAPGKSLQALLWNLPEPAVVLTVGSRLPTTLPAVALARAG